jgi:hypothetical protein
VPQHEQERLQRRDRAFHFPGRFRKTLGLQQGKLPVILSATQAMYAHSGEAEAGFDMGPFSLDQIQHRPQSKGMKGLSEDVIHGKDRQREWSQKPSRRPRLDQDYVRTHPPTTWTVRACLPGQPGSGIRRDGHIRHAHMYNDKTGLPRFS